MQHSLRNRLAWAMSLLTTVVIAILAVALFLAAEEREEELIDEIVNTALNNQIAHSSPQQANALPQHLQFFRAPIGQQPANLPAELRSFPIGNSEWYDADIEYHVGVREVGKERFYVLYNTERHEQHLKDLHLHLIFVALLLSALAWLFGRFFAGSLLSQLIRLADSVQLDQPPELTPKMDEEVAVLAKAIAQFRTEKQQLLQREREFSAHVSHELRTPLTRIRTTAELLAETAQLAPQHQQRCEKIITAVDDLEQKLRALLFLARDIQPATTQVISLRHALDRAVERLPEQDKQLAWHNHIPADYWVSTDPALLDLLLDNVLGNAWRYTPTGSVSATLNGDELMIADTGSGIDAQALPHVFIPYQRASDIAGGHGLGLAIVARICAVYAWTCRIESTQDTHMHGSQVFLNFKPSPN